jgi:hypothetical protein
MENLKVCNLFNGGGLGMVDSLFNEHEATCIKQMELLNVEENDVMIWNKSRNGVFSVKSAYYSIMEELLDKSSLRIEGNWMQIWKS